MDSRTSFIALLVALALAGVASAQPYQIQALDTVANGIEAHAMGINDLGQIVGYVKDADGNSHAVRWQSSGAGQELPYPSDNRVSEAYRINNAGLIAGKARVASGATHAAVWDASGATAIGTLGGPNSFAQDVNEAGVVVGSTDATRGSVAFTWTSGGGMVNYGNFNTNDAQQRAGFNGINNHGLLVGTAYRLFSPFKAIKGTLGTPGVTEISPPGQFSTGMALAVKDAGTIVGFQNPGSGSARAAIFNGDGTYTDLGALGLTDSSANDVNNAGVIVGDAFGEDAGGVFRAYGFVYQNGTMTDLMTLLPAGSGWSEIFEVNGINEFGQIVGAGLFNGEVRAFVMTPVPEPGSVTVLAIAGAGLLARRRRPGAHTSEQGGL